MRPRAAVYILFLVSLSIWVGGGVFDSISSHPAWHADPVAYVRGPAPPRGVVNPWPYTTGLLALATLMSLLVFVPARGPGRREVLVANGAVVLVLIATAVYFVPVLSQLAHPERLSDPQITSLSLMWIRLNVLRQVFLLGVLTYALIGLMRLSGPSDPSAT